MSSIGENASHILEDKRMKRTKKQQQQEEDDGIETNFDLLDDDQKTKFDISNQHISEKTRTKSTVFDDFIDQSLRSFSAHFGSRSKDDEEEDDGSSGDENDFFPSPFDQPQSTTQSSVPRRRKLSMQPQVTSSSHPISDSNRLLRRRGSRMRSLSFDKSLMDDKYIQTKKELKKKEKKKKKKKKKEEDSYSPSVLDEMSGDEEEEEENDDTEPIVVERKRFHSSDSVH